MHGSILDHSLTSAIHVGPWWRHRGILLLNLYLILPLITGCINGFDGSLVNGLQVLPAWKKQFHDPKGKTLGLIGSAQMIGSVVAIPFTPFCADIFGRRVAMVIGAVQILGGVALEATAWTVSQFIGSRVLVGAGMAFSTNAAPLLIAELAYPTHRGKVTALYNTLWYGGSIVASWACLIAYNSASDSIWSWRAPILVQILGPLLQIALIWFVPESPRWLISRGLESKAAQILSRFHGSNRRERDPLVQYEMAQIRHAIRMEKEMNKNFKYLPFITPFATAGNRRRMRIVLAIAFFSQWSGNGLVSYYMSLVMESIGITNTRTQSTISGCLQIWDLATALAGAFLIDQIGRRRLFIISTAGMLISFSVWSLTIGLAHSSNESTRTPAARATIPFIFMFYLFYNLAYSPMLVAYALEVLPYAIRAQGFAWMNMAVSAALAFNQFVSPMALNALGWKYYLVYCGWLVFELGFVILYVVETRGRTLEETAALFDGEDKPNRLAQLAREAIIVFTPGVSGVSSDDHDEEGIYSERGNETESYELKRPKLILEKDRLGYTKGSEKQLSYPDSV